MSNYFNENMNYVCRTCLLPDNGEMITINSVKCINNQYISITEMIALCVGLEISKHDKVTNLLCKSCADILTKAYNYRITCWNSHRSLLQHQQQRDVIEKTGNAIGVINCNTDEVIELDLANIENINTNEVVTASTDDAAINEDLVIVQPKLVLTESQKLSDHTEIILDKTCYLGKRYVCRTCNHFFMRRDKIITHLRLAHGIIISIPNGNTCNICFKIFEAPCLLKKHNETVHNSTTFICDLCGASLKTKSTFEQHLRRHTGEKPYKCKFCDYRSSHNTTIVSHQRRVHTGETPFICHLCGDGFISASRRSEHMTIHSEPQFECIVCQKQFKALNQYKKHIIIHDLTKYVACDVCGQKFAKRSNMKTHRKQHTGEKNHTCNECNKGFIQRHCWRTHMKNHHNKIVV